MSAKEVSIRVSNDEQSYTKKFLVYEDFYLSDNDDTINRLKEEALQDFKGVVEDIAIRVKMML